MPQVRPHPPSGILRQLLARIQPVTAVPVAASPAFMMLASTAALAQTLAKSERYGYNPNGVGAIPTLPGGTAFHPNTAPATHAGMPWSPTRKSDGALA